MRSQEYRRLLFLALVTGCCAIAVSYVFWTVRRQDRGVDAAPRGGSAPVTLSTASPALLQRPHILFRNTSTGDTWGTVVVTSLDTPSPGAATPLRCDRVDFASGTGICLVLYSGQSLVNSVYIFGPEFHLRHTLPLGGLPSRARVSPDGRYAVFTVFVTGHSYADAGFSTQTLILDTTNGNIVANLEEFAVTKSGARFQAPDFNFWGVTFTQDSNRFYATLSSRNRIYLVEGDVGTKTAHVLREDVECPSLSPDNQRLAFKRRVPAGTGFRWEIHLLDLASGEERALTAERRNVDDQVEWYDNEHLLYALPDDGPSATPGENVWMLPTDGAPPQLYLQKASSPAVVREARSTALLP